MSIINDALKKLQSNLEKKKSQNTSPGPSETPLEKPTQQALANNVEEKKSQISLPPFEHFPKEPRNKAPNPNLIPLPDSRSVKSKPRESHQRMSFLLFVVYFFICGFLIFLIIQRFFPLRTTRGPDPIPKKNFYPLNSGLNIEGIMVMENKNVVLINNEIYEEGEFLQGMKIIKISMDRIELLDNGKIKTLNVNK